MDDIIIKIRKEAVRHEYLTGIRPTVIYIGLAAYERFKEHPLVQELKGYSTPCHSDVKAPMFEGKVLLRVMDDPEHLRAAGPRDGA